ncbi:gluconokinase [Pediococcus argentinicus]|uniref:Gluconate kinase n=1 Tax=Pediococcus argentinicus TaxID=480391 RepID=A0A0R2NK86_9LACO|nr:FGGY family carbohydrate kinase [Pediococcus argentinicus]KRO26168.1 hypothetical protein IV88_GL000628 [Pediococcus argentinicus]NKZ21627.1 gluconate kinase [Pediococcus argentinicus]GEP18788.1 gluconokinase [Pediococcus argentinicus]
MDYMIGTDIGTTSTKSVLYDENGKVVEYSNLGYPMYHDVPEAAEEDPDEILNAILQTIQNVTKSVDSEHVLGISFSAAMHSLILLDGNHKPISRVMTWADNRAGVVLGQFKQEANFQNIYQETGTPIHPMNPLVKLYWLSHAYPAMMENTGYIAGIKEYVIYKLTGEFKMDYSIANATGLFNLHTFNWNPESLKLAGVKSNQLPDLVDTDYVIDNINSDLVNELGLNSNTKIIMGASDGALSNLGVGADQEGVAAVTIGTSGAVRVMTTEPYLDPEGKLFCYYVAPHKWIVGGPVNNGGQVLQWAREELLDHLPFEEINKLVDNTPAGAHGLIFNSYMSGERAPLWNSNAQSSLVGLTFSHTKADIARAVMEGIVINLNEVLNLTKKSLAVNEIHATGGFTQSEVWCQILADVLGQSVTVPDSFESSCLAAAVIGWKALGKIESLDIIRKMVGTTKEFKPNAKNHEVYQKLIRLFEDVEQQMEPLYGRIAELQEELNGEER